MLNGDHEKTAQDPFRVRLESVLAEHYELHEELGRGGMGIVYRAVDRRLKRTVALKLLPPELAFRADVRSRFLREAVSAAHLSHPNVVPIYSVDERDGLVFFVMGFVSGENLAAVISREGSMAPGRARRIITEVAGALAYAHERGVVHRDIKPDNIILDGETDRAMVTDFGIARALSESGETRLTATGVAIGTPAYMSPEQCVSEAELDGRTDLYSLGVVGYQLLCGRTPFEASSTPAMMMKHFSEEPEDLKRRNPKVPDDLAGIIMQLLEKKPENRFASGRDLVSVLSGEAKFVRAPARTPRASAARGQVPAVEPERAARDAALPRAASEERSRRKKPRVKFQDQPLPEQVRLVRSDAFGYVATVLFLFTVNMITSPQFPWFMFPALGIGMDVGKKLFLLWERGLRWKQIFGADARRIMAQDPGFAQLEHHPPTSADPAEQYAPRELLQGAHGPVVRQAIADHEGIKAQVGRLSKADRALIPDLLATARDLLDRVVMLGEALSSLDKDVDMGKIRLLDERIAVEERETGPGAVGGGSTEGGQRKLALLRKQRSSMQQLVDARSAMHSQFEGAALMLENLALDVLKLRSAGMQSVANDVNSATKEARALIREIGYVVGAAEEIRAMESQPWRESK